MSWTNLLSIAPILLVIPGIIPVIRQNNPARINLSVWAVITANSWLAAIGTLLSVEKGTSGLYLLLNAIIITPVLLANLRKGVWSNLPPCMAPSFCVHPTNRNNSWTLPRWRLCNLVLLFDFYTFNCSAN